MRMHDLDDLADQGSIAEYFGVQRSAVSNWADRHRTFPQPITRLGGRPVYSWVMVRSWYIAHFGQEKYNRQMSQQAS